MPARENELLQLESAPKVADIIDLLSTGHLVKMKKIDWIGVDNFLCVLPCFVNNLKISIIWSSCFEKFKFVNQVRLLIYSKYLICWCGIIQYLKTYSRLSSFSQWWRMMRNKNTKNLFIYYYLLLFFNYFFFLVFEF